MITFTLTDKLMVCKRNSNSITISIIIIIIITITSIVQLKWGIAGSS